MWIHDSISIKEEQFEQKVNIALQNISERIQRQEVISTMVNQAQFNPQSITLNKKSAGSKYSSDLITGLQDYVHFQNQATQLEGLEFGFSMNSEGIAQSTKTDEQSLNLQYSFAIKDPSNDLKALLSENKKTQIDIIQNVIKQLNTDKKIEERISNEALTLMIDEELKNLGIHTTFVHGILNEGNNEMIYCEERHEEKLRRSRFKIALFQNEFLQQKNLLAVFFPNQDKFLIKSVSMMFYGSLLFVILIVSCFWYAVNTIIKQRLLSEMKTDFINNMTHELKTPISTISLATEALNESSVQDDKTKRERFINVIRKENDRLKLQVEKVLQFAKLDRKEFQVNLTDVNIHTLFEEIISSYQLQLKEKNGVIHFDPCAVNHMIKADPFLLKNAINNLIDNAIKYTPENPVIEIKTRCVQKGIFFSISDNGIGIEKENISKIFEKFYRVSSGDKHDVKGFGLGLSYVKSIVDTHHGQIKIKSELKKGTTFEVFLPFN